MPCPRSEIHFRATDTELHASFKGPLDHEGGQLLRSLGERARDMNATRILLDVAEMHALEPAGISLLLELEQAVGYGQLWLYANGAPSAQMLIGAGLARLLRPS